MQCRPSQNSPLFSCPPLPCSNSVWPSSGSICSPTCRLASKSPRCTANRKNSFLWSQNLQETLNGHTISHSPGRLWQMPNITKAAAEQHNKTSAAPQNGCQCYSVQVDRHTVWLLMSTSSSYLERAMAFSCPLRTAPCREYSTYSSVWASSSSRGGASKCSWPPYCNTTTIQTVSQDSQNALWHLEGWLHYFTFFLFQLWSMRVGILDRDAVFSNRLKLRQSLHACRIVTVGVNTAFNGYDILCDLCPLPFLGCSPSASVWSPPSWL